MKFSITCNLKMEFKNLKLQKFGRFCFPFEGSCIPDAFEAPEPFTCKGGIMD